MALTAGTLSQLTVGQDRASLSATAATGGTGPYTYQWHRSTTSGFSPGAGSLLYGETALTLNDLNLDPATTYYYKVVSTDGFDDSTIPSAQLAVTTIAVLRDTYAGTLNSKLAEARQAGFDTIFLTNLASLTTQLAAAASHGQRKFTINFPVTFQPADLRGATACNVVSPAASSASRCGCGPTKNMNGPLWPAFQSGVYQALFSQNIMDNEVTVQLNTSDQLATSIDLLFNL